MNFYLKIEREREREVKEDYLSTTSVGQIEREESLRKETQAREKREGEERIYFLIIPATS